MTSKIALILVITFSITVVHSMDCSFGTSDNIADKFLRSCPTLFGDQNKKYCCIDKKFSDSLSFYCCDAQEWALETGLSIIVPAIISVLVIVTLFVLCISCLCCSCCPWYRRRHRGAVYGTVHVVHTGGAQQVPVSNPPATHVVNNVQPPYPVNQPPYMVNQPPYTINQNVPAGTFQNQPPPYSAELYAKQAPYNPTYPK